jgi:hypothetical protein
MIGRIANNVLRRSRQRTRPQRKVCPFCFEADHVGGHNHIPHVTVDVCQLHHVWLTEERLTDGAEMRKQPTSTRSAEMALRSDYDGRIATIQIPQGGTFTHTWSGGTAGNGLWCDNPTIGAYNASAATLTIGNGTGTWTFARTIGGGTYPNRTITTTVTKPDGSKAVTTA